MIRKRITTFIVALIITIFFIVAAILAIFLAQGNKLDGTDGLVQTSIINLNTLPDEVNVFVNDKRVDRVEKRIENLDPGTVILRVEKEGYTTWEKELILQAGVVKDVNVQLFPKNLELSALTQSNIDKAIFSKDSEYIFYSVLDETKLAESGIWRLKLSRNLLNLTENRPTKVLSLEVDKINKLRTSDYVIKPTRDNSRFILYAPSISLLEVYDANTGKLINIENALIGFPTQIDWFNGSSSFVVSVNNLVYEYDIGARQLNIITFDAAANPIYSVSTSRVVYFNKANNKYFVYKNKSSLELDTFNKTINSIVPSRILTSDTNEDILSILSTDKTLYFYDEEKLYQAAFKDVDSIINVSSELTEYVLTKGKDIFSLFLENTVDNKSYNSTLSSLNTKTDGITYSTLLENSNSIAFVKSLENQKSNLTIMDKDGENSKDFFGDERLTSEPIAISSNGSELYLILNEKEGDRIVDNLYKLILLK